MEVVILVGIQASGKSSFYREQFFATHMRISFDLLRTRHRERSLLGWCLGHQQPFVVDTTNVTAAERGLYRAGAGGWIAGGRLRLESDVPSSIRRACLWLRLAARSGAWNCRVARRAFESCSSRRLAMTAALRSRRGARSFETLNRIV